VAIEDGHSFYATERVNILPSLIRAGGRRTSARATYEQGGLRPSTQAAGDERADRLAGTDLSRGSSRGGATRSASNARPQGPRSVELLYVMHEALTYGNGAHGIETAAETYFHTGRRAAAQLPAWPRCWPHRPRARPRTTRSAHPRGGARARRRRGHRPRWRELGGSTPAAAATRRPSRSASAHDVGVFKQKVEPFFVYYIRQPDPGQRRTASSNALGPTRRLQRVHTLYQGGLKINTSLDPKLAGRSGVDAIKRRVTVPPSRAEQRPDASLVLSARDGRGDQGDGLGARTTKA
jgi:hypothetical protein